MAYSYKVLHLDKTSHNLRYKYNDSFTPTEITYHQTSNNAQAINERNYLNNRTDGVYIGFHLVVDEAEAIECMPLNINTWHSGDGANGAGNTKSIGVEIARSTHSDINLRNKAIENGALLIANLMVKFNIPMNKVYSHNQRSGKNCPHDIRGRYGEDKFRKLIQEKYDELTKPKVTYRVRKTWADASSQKGAYSELNNAKVECNKHSGYSVYDENGKAVYTNAPQQTASVFKEYKVKIVNCDYLNARTSPDSSSSKNIKETVKVNTILTIVGEQGGWLKTKSGLWISKSYTQKC